MSESSRANAGEKKGVSPKVAKGCGGCLLACIVIAIIANAGKRPVGGGGSGSVGGTPATPGVVGPAGSDQPAHPPRVGSLKGKVSLMGVTPENLMWHNLDNFEWTNAEVTIVSGDRRFKMGRGNVAWIGTVAAGDNDGRELRQFVDDRGVPFHQGLGIDAVEILADQGAWKGKLGQ